MCRVGWEPELSWHKGASPAVWHEVASLTVCGGGCVEDDGAEEV